MRFKGLHFPEAVAYLAGKPAPSGKPTRPRPPAAGARQGPWQAARASPRGCPWPMPWRWWRTPRNASGRPRERTRWHTRGRGLTAETIRAARLGWTPELTLPTVTEAATGEHPGSSSLGSIATAWRWSRSASPREKDPEVRRSVPRPPELFPAPSVVRLGKPLVIVEGEFDALLLGQDLGDLAAVVTLGSASSKPEGPPSSAGCWPPPRGIVATDADEAGDKAASGWPARAIRVRPPAPCKDWTEARQAGIDLRRWWTDRLGGIEGPPLRSWEELAAKRWGPAISDPTPGIIIGRPDRGRMLAAFEAAADDPYAIEERSAIQTEGLP